MAGIVLGLNAVTARNTGTTAAPVYVVMNLLRDETLNIEMAQADVTTRAANGWKLDVPTLATGTIEAKILYDTGDTNFTALRTAFFSRTRLLMAFFDGPAATSGTQGLVGGFGITQWNVDRNIEDALMISIRLTVRENDVGAGPSWVTVP